MVKFMLQSNKYSVIARLLKGGKDRKKMKSNISVYITVYVTNPHME